jgi:hypothetical protein
MVADATTERGEMEARMVGIIIPENRQELNLRFA